MDLSRYILAGKSTFTVHNTESGGRFTFKVSKPKDGENIWFASVLTGPQNTNDYTYMGIIRRDPDGTLTVHQTAKSKVGQDAKSWLTFVWLVQKILIGGSQLPSQVEFLPSGRCCRCGRTLTTPESIKLGVGPECASKL